MVTTISIKEDMMHDGQTVLSYTIEYPEFKSTQYQLSLSVINKYYKTQAEIYQKHLKKKQFPAAVEEYENALETSTPVQAYEAILKYKLCYLEPCVISLYQDQYEYTAGAHGSTTRRSQTWNVPACRMIRLGELFGCGLHPKEYILEQATEQIQANPGLYFDDYEALAAETFQEDSFYCTPKGVVFYYQQYDISPYSSGIREFLLPYSRCVRDPKQFCKL